MTTSKTSTMASSSVIIERITFRCNLGRIVQVKTTEFCSTSDCVGFVWSRNCSRNKGKPNCSQLKTAVKLHTDQMMRTRNFRVQTDVVERRSVPKSQKEKKAYVERKVGECFQWKAHGQCSERDSCSFSHDIRASGNRRQGQRRKGRPSAPTSHSKAKQTDGGGQKSSKESGTKEESSSDKKKRNSMPIQIL